MIGKVGVHSGIQNTSPSSLCSSYVSVFPHVVDPSSGHERFRMRADNWGRKARAADDLGVYGKPVPLPSSRAGLQLPLPMTSARQLVDYPGYHLT